MMKLTVLLFLTCISDMLLSQSATRQFARKLLAPSDSFRSLSIERQRSLRSQMTSAGTKGQLLLFTDRSGAAKNTEVSFLGKLQRKDVYRVDLSAVVSKYIGETEKNLEILFRDAELNNWMLFFDEADELFGEGQSSDQTATLIQQLAINHRATIIFYCREDCLRRFGKMKYLLIK